MPRKNVLVSCIGVALLVAGGAGLTGCGNRAARRSANGSGPEGPGKPGSPAAAVQVPPDETGAALSMRKAAGTFRVTLKVDGPVRNGENRFIADVSRKGKPVPGATVSILLSMPTMKMLGPEMPMKPGDHGRFEGTADLTMAGNWQANVTIEAGAERGSVVYDFVVPAAPAKPS